MVLHSIALLRFGHVITTIVGLTLTLAKMRNLVHRRLAGTGLVGHIVSPRGHGIIGRRLGVTGNHLRWRCLRHRTGGIPQISRRQGQVRGNIVIVFGDKTALRAGIGLPGANGSSCPTWSSHCGGFGHTCMGYRH